MADTVITASGTPQQGSAQPVDLSAIAARWKFRGTGGRSQVAAAGLDYDSTGIGATLLAPPPDLRAEFLRLRADLLRREPLLSNQEPTVEQELSTTLLKLLKAETEVKDLSQRLYDLQSLFDEVSRQRESQNEIIAKLQHELMESRRQLEEERAATRQRSGGGASSAGVLSPQGSLTGHLATANYRSVQLAAAHAKPIAPQRAVSPSASSSTKVQSSRSPARAR